MISCPMKENTHNPHPLRFMVFLCFLSALVATELWQIKASNSGADLGGGCRGCAPPPPRDDLRFSNTTGILQKKRKTMWFIGVEVEQETSAPTPKKNPGSAPAICVRVNVIKIKLQCKYIKAINKDHLL